MSMATSNSDEMKSISSPLDLSLKVVNIRNTEHNANEFDPKSVSSEELLGLKLLHDRLSKTMELLLPTEKSKKNDGQMLAEFPSSTSDNTAPEFDYRATMRALLALVESENVSANEEEEKPTNFFQSKAPAPQPDSWSYWQDYILSLYLMNSSLPSSLPPMPTAPPTQVPQHLPSAFNFLPPSPNSMLFQSMLNNLINRTPTKPHDDCTPKSFHLQENINQDFGYKNKKLNSYQFLKDPGMLYNSFAASRNLGISKTKLLDSPESFGVSLRGNQKYSIYYQQRPNNIFNNNFLSPNCSSSLSSKLSQNSNYKNSSSNFNHYSHDSHLRKPHMSLDSGHKKATTINNTTTNKLQKSFNRTDPHGETSTKSSEKGNKFSNFEHTTFKDVNNDSSIGGVFETIPGNIQLCNRHRETVFNCSCGQEFENLYSFTIHMKSTHHTPNSSKIERSIPKLVRGQDMWINSETEQTKEILRCMRCHQSFRTLPELTMHMVETNHYSEIVYSDTGKCVFLNSDHLKIKPSYTTISSPISSPGDVIRKLKRTLSSSTGSDIGTEEDNGKRTKLSSPLESLKDDLAKDEILEKIDIAVEFREEIKSEETLQITEADSATIDVQPDSDSQRNFEVKDSHVNSTNSNNCVIRQIEDFVEKSLPKPAQTEYSVPSSVFSNTISNSRPGRSTAKSTTSKSGHIDRTWKTESKAISLHDKPDSFSKPAVKSAEFDGNFSSKGEYQMPSTENAENPLSSLQTLVETLQKNTGMVKNQSPNNYKPCPSQNKDAYSYPAKSPVVCDSLSQLQALVAGTSMSNIVSQTGATYSRSHDLKHPCYSLTDRSKQFGTNNNPDSSATFLSWCYKLGELLGLPQALSQAMLTQDAIKELTSSVLCSKPVNQSSQDDHNDPEEEGLTNGITNSETKSFQARDPDPLEQLKNLLNSTADGSYSNKFLGPSNTHPHSPPTISKKAKCHFCNKPFANKGQVRLHISKGKCASLMRSNHSGFEVPTNRNTPPANFESGFQSSYKVKESVGAESSGREDHEQNSAHTSSSRDPLVIANKSVNLIREYFKFAKHMIGNNSETKDESPHKVENRIE